MQGEGSQMLLSVEADAYIEALEKVPVKDIGSPHWLRQHEYVEKLNMQAVLNAANQEDEFVKEFLISMDKIPVLIHDLIVTEVWKQKIWPEFVKMKFNPKTTFSLYMVLYHEATVINLLETILFHRETCEAAEDSILDLLDYCYRKLCHLAGRDEEQNEEEEETTKGTHTNLQELEKQKKTLDFDISIKAVSIIRYISDHLANLPLSTTSRILNTHDVPLLLVELVTNPPWTKYNNGKLEKYVDNKWQVIPSEERFHMTKIEGQVWIALFNLLMGSECQNKYELDSFRKNTILKLRAHLTEVTLDQMPVLAEMQRYLEHLSMMEPPPVKNELILEQVPEIRENIVNEFEGKWDKLAKKQSKAFFNPSDADIREQARRLADTYNFDTMDSLLVEPPKCAACGEPAGKRCSRCQNEWYCRRECQVQHWKKHKPACNLLVDSLQKIKLTDEKDKNS